jgi:Na+-transporting methylmalonyl-CoA/oxaloacetate decarboxylase gamma subunit
VARPFTRVLFFAFVLLGVVEAFVFLILFVLLLALIFVSHVLQRWCDRLREVMPTALLLECGADAPAPIEAIGPKGAQGVRTQAVKRGKHALCKGRSTCGYGRGRSTMFDWRCRRELGERLTADTCRAALHKAINVSFLVARERLHALGVILRVVHHPLDLIPE